MGVNFNGYVVDIMCIYDFKKLGEFSDLIKVMIEY